MSFKQFAVEHVLPVINRVASLVSLKVVTRSTPNRDFDSFLRHLGTLGYKFGTVIDVGIAFGTPGLYTANAGAVFHFVEPVPACRPVLEALVREHGGHAHPVAAGERDGSIDFFVHPDTSGSSTKRQYEGEFFDGEKVTVPVRRLDSLISRPLQRPALLKIDTQGAELEVLAGAGQLMDEIDVVIIEVSFHQFREGAPELHEVVAQMAALGFRAYETLEGHYRAVDNAQAQVDIAFVRNDSRLRAVKSYFSDEQAKAYMARPVS
jgi:FkbM family methyltransferase